MTQPAKTSKATKRATRKSLGYRVVYGETMPAWEQSFPTLREARAFATKHESFGDVIFSITKIVAGQAPMSRTAALDAAALVAVVS